MSNMVTCENCIHYDVCEYRGLDKYPSEQALKDDCSHFMGKQSEWISVEDGLPKKEGLYLVYTKKGYIEIDRFAIFDVGYYWVELEDSVTHWMPLPGAPKEVK